MAEAWHEGLPDDAFMAEADRQYMLEIRHIREALARGLGFDEAIALIEEKDEEVKSGIIDDTLKVLIAEEHFAKGIALEEMAQGLKIPVERLESAKKSMLDEIVGDASMREYLNELDQDNPGRIDA
ncbi:MAG: hypothetical protein C0402_08645 [Thermodesulfovibrio sp.]|nr:hypothetical protein [Thermodesulfovibrio sp.]